MTQDYKEIEKALYAKESIEELKRLLQDFDLEEVDKNGFTPQ